MMTVPFTKEDDDAKQSMKIQKMIKYLNDVSRYQNIQMGRRFL